MFFQYRVALIDIICYFIFKLFLFLFFRVLLNNIHIVFAGMFISSPNAWGLGWFNVYSDLLHAEILI